MFKKFIKIILLSLLIVLITLQTSIVFAEDESPLRLEVLTDKDDYQVDDEIIYHIELTNHSEFSANDIILRVELPKELELIQSDSEIKVNNELVWELESLDSLEQSTLTFTTKLKTDTSEVPIIKPELAESSDGGNGSVDTSETTPPKTGDETNILGYLVIFVLSVASFVIAYLIYRKKQVSKASIVGVLLIGILISPISSINATGKQFSFTETSNIKVGDAEYDLIFTVEATITEELTLAGDWEMDDDDLLNWKLSWTPTNESKSYDIYRSYTGEAADFERIAENILEDHYYAKDFEINGEAYYYVTISGEDIQSNTVKADGLLDSDGDELTDTMEYLIGTDPFNPDTDGDGLTDYEEIYLTFTDPLIYDTNGSGISDGEEDFDGDGLNNIQELLYGTDPYNDDTDEDGLTDYDEIFVYYTDPLSTDTDADGLSDILEIEYDMDPNNPDTLNDGILDGDRIFTVTKYSKHSNEDDSVKPKLEIELEGKQIESLTITKVDEKDIFLNDKIPGYLGNAFDFEVEGEFSSATLTYEFDQQLLNDPNFIPAIYYWDETEQFLFEIPDQTIEGNTVSAPVSHFSSYMVIAKNSYDEELFRFEVLPPTDEEMQSVNYDLALVLDKSSSISRRNYDLMKNLSGNLVQSLDDEDRISVFTFDSVVRRHSGFETKDVVTSIISGLPNPSGLTAIYSAIDMANQEFVTHSSDDATKVMIVLTDGFDNRSAVSSSSVAQTAIDNDIVIYTVGVGSVNVDILTNIAESTGGAYYSASNFSDLEGIFDKLQVDIDLYRDSDSDGISDYHEKKIAAGELKLGTGAPMMHFDKLNHLNPDSDGDGLLDGQEMKIKSQTVQGKEVFYSYLYSNPSMEDSDSDGLLDNEDPTPLIEHDHRFERIFDPNYRPVNSGVTSAQEDSDHVYNTENAGFNDYWIREKTFITITGGYIAFMPQSASALSHFLENTGDLYTIDAKKLINQSSNAENHLYENLNDILSASEAMVMDGSTMVITTNEAFVATTLSKEGTDDRKEKDWWYTLGNSSSAMTSTVRRTGEEYSMEIKYFIDDFYDWEKDSPLKGGPIITDGEMYRLHEVGLAKQYPVEGCYEVNVTWKKGERFLTNSQEPTLKEARR